MRVHNFNVALEKRVMRIAVLHQSQEGNVPSPCRLDHSEAMAVEDEHVVEVAAAALEKKDF